HTLARFKAIRDYFSKASNAALCRVRPALAPRVGWRCFPYIADVTPDILGNAYEYLIAKFADDAGKKGGEFYTPKEVVRLIVECIGPEEGMSIYDPACGSGGMLLEAVHYLEKKGKNTKALKLYGQERNLNTWAICQMNLFLHDIDDSFVEKGDTLRDPKHLSGTKQLQTFDRVLANPPFSLDSWGHDEWKGGDKFGRDKYGCPPKSYGDLAFVQHMVASLSSYGKMGVVLPHGILFRGGAEAKIREGLIREDLIDAVIGIAPNLFYGTGIPACVLIVDRHKPKAHKGQILVINGAKEFIEGKNQNRLSDEHVKRLAGAYHEYKDEDKFARVVPLKEIGENEFNLNISRYVHIGEEQEAIDVKAEFAKLQQLIKERDETERKMIGYLKELGYGS
ncbi:MAG: type I restriction-modification system subunit M, partial [Deltaproteobacteria bacterium]|nr:type I restriction-modification system subunit M [Deltaproteobacteria bacterium]